jgi:tetratricopeptide (TPR) repeat protein
MKVAVRLVWARSAAVLLVVGLSIAGQPVVGLVGEAPPASTAPAEGATPPAGDSAGDPADAIAALIKDRQYAPARARVAEALADLRARGGADSLAEARLLDLQAEATYRAMRPDEHIVDILNRALAIKKRQLGPDDPAVADTHHHLGNCYSVQERREDAIAEYREALRIREKAFGSDSLKLVPTLNNLCGTLNTAGRAREGVPVCERALAIREKQLAPDDPDVAISLNTLGNILMEVADYRRAEEMLRRALAIREAKLGAAHPQVAMTLNGLGTALQYQGRYDEVESLYIRAIAILDGIGAPAHGYLTNLAVLRTELGDFGGARQAVERALEQLHADPIQNQRTYGLALNNFGYLLMIAGDLSAASERLEEALAVRTAALPADHPDLGETLTNLGTVASRKGDSVEARRQYGKALDLRERVLGRDHPLVAESLANLGQALAAGGRLDEAQTDLERALRIARDRLGPSHPQVAATQRLLADVLLAKGNVVAAETACRESLQMRERLFGPRHPAVGMSLLQSAAVRRARGDTPGAIQDALRAEAIGRDEVRLTIAAMTGREALALAAIRPRGVPLALAMLMPESPDEARRSVLDAVVRSRALVLDRIALRLDAARLPGPEAAQLARFTELEKRLSAMVIRGPDPRSPDAYLPRIEETRRQADEAERLLGGAARRDPAFEASLDDIQRFLPPGTALVSYVYQATGNNPDFAGGASGSTGDTPRYVAFVLRPEARSPEFISLGTASSIDGMVRRWNDEIGRGPTRGTATEPKRDEGTYRHAGEALRGAVWDPIGRAIGGAGTIFVVPDGSLQLVTFATLPAREGGYLIERAPVVELLTAERDLLLGARARPGRAASWPLGSSTTTPPPLRWPPRPPPGPSLAERLLPRPPRSFERPSCRRIRRPQGHPAIRSRGRRSTPIEPAAQGAVRCGSLGFPRPGSRPARSPACGGDAVTTSRSTAARRRANSASRRRRPGRPPCTSRRTLSF